MRKKELKRKKILKGNFDIIDSCYEKKGRCNMQSNDSFILLFIKFSFYTKSLHYCITFPCFLYVYKFDSWEKIYNKK